VSSGNADRCGYRLERERIDDSSAAEQCDRRVWEDHDRCVWHAPVEGKSLPTLEEEGELAAGDSLDGAYLAGAVLLGADQFEDASLVGADLVGANLKGADFTGADLTLADMSDVNGLGADFTGANLEGAVLTKADLRQANLEGARLHETVFTDATVGAGTSMDDVAVYDREATPPDLTRSQPLEAATWVYRQLQELYRDNGLAQLARHSYYLEKDARRRLAWKRQNRAEAVKHELSRWVMGYGDSPYRVLGTALVVIVLFALLFPLTGGITETKDGRALAYVIRHPGDASPWWIGQVFLKSLYFSIVTFTTLGYGDAQPLTPSVRFLAGFEAVLGAILAALLVFVLARIVTW